MIVPVALRVSEVLFLKFLILGQLVLGYVYGFAKVKVSPAQPLREALSATLRSCFFIFFFVSHSFALAFTLTPSFVFTSSYGEPLDTLFDSPYRWWSCWNASYLGHHPFLPTYRAARVLCQLLLHVAALFCLVFSTVSDPSGLGSSRLTWPSVQHLCWSARLFESTTHVMLGSGSNVIRLCTHDQRIIFYFRPTREIKPFYL